MTSLVFAPRHGRAPDSHASTFLSRPAGARHGLTLLRSWALSSLLLLIGLVFSTLAFAASKTLPGPVVSVDALENLIGKQAVAVLDLRPLFKEDKKTPIFGAGHIPGALPAPYGKFRGTKTNPGQLPDEKEFSAFISGLGLQKNQPIVIVSEGKTGTDFGAAARVYWTLKIAGFEDLAVLDGGLAAWLAAKKPLATGLPSLVAKPISVSFDRSQIVTVDQVQSLTQAGASESRLLDARPESFYKGDVRHPAAARWGTLPGANHFDSEEWFQPKTGLLKPLDSIRSVAQAKRACWPQTIRSPSATRGTGLPQTGLCSQKFLVSRVRGFTPTRWWPGVTQACPCRTSLVEPPRFSASCLAQVYRSKRSAYLIT